MAGSRRRQRDSALVAVYDYKVGYLVFRFSLKGLFSDESTSSLPQEVLPFPPSPVACFRRHPHCAELMALVASPKGNKIVVATDSRRTIVYDTTKSEYSSGPDQRGAKPRPILVAGQGRRRRDMFLMTTYPDFSESGPQFEALRLQGGDRLRSLPVPPPPIGYDRRHLWGLGCQVSSYFAMGQRVWLSMKGEGTYSFDMARREWRHEGSWVLPLEDRAVYVPELGLLLGFKRMLFFCAYDITASPPVIRQQWRWSELAPSKHQKLADGLDFICPGLAYLGGGRFCVSWSTNKSRDDKIGRRLFALTAVEVTRSGGGKLQLCKRRSRCYLMSPDQTRGYVL
ncbi:unnamed protein product [Urochloa decumbens]|uniref:Uncharacterized protein n=1 Tax=Urochloa decumbens TaxID=240449 RepID=A0ABC9DVT1_9POAL